MSDRSDCICAIPAKPPAEHHETCPLRHQRPGERHFYPLASGLVPIPCTCAIPSKPAAEHHETCPVRLRAAAAPHGCSPLGWCEAMTEALGGHAAVNATGKGLSVMFGWLESSPGRHTRAKTLGVTYKPRAGHEGIVLTVCPWCAASLKFYAEAV